MTRSNKLHSDVKMARFERKHLVNHSKYHKITCKRFHRAERKAAKQHLNSLK